MMRNNDAISPYQLALMTIAAIVSVGVFSLPASVDSKAGPDGWMIILVAGILVLFAGFIIVKLNLRFVGRTFADYSIEIVGMIPGKILTLAYLCYFSMAIAFVARTFTEVIKMFLLFRTPTEVILLSLLLSGAYIVRGGVESVARLCEIIFPLLFIPFFLILIPGGSLLDFSNLLPFFQEAPSKLVRALPNIVLTYAGLEVALFYIGFMRKPKRAYRPIILAVSFTIFFYLLTTILCTAAFGAKATASMMWPLVNYIRSINLPGLFIERLDGVVLGIWVMTVFSTIIIYYFLVSYTTSKLFNTKEQKQFVLPLGIFFYYLALQPDNLVQLYQWANIIFSFATPLLMMGVPLLLLFIASIRKMGVKTNEKE